MVSYSRDFIVTSLPYLLSVARLRAFLPCFSPGFEAPRSPEERKKTSERERLESRRKGLNLQVQYCILTLFVKRLPDVILYNPFVIITINTTLLITIKHINRNQE